MTVRVAYDHLLTAGEDVDVDALVHTVTLVWARTLGLQGVQLPVSTVFGSLPQPEEERPCPSPTTRPSR
jgi:hypothetical protein